jgi:hypothetical protein
VKKRELREYVKSVTSAKSGAEIVRSWRDNFVKESNGIPLLLIVGGKVLYADQILSNIAFAVEDAEKARTK